jgi:ketosteroid isomerase-like protein
LLAGLATIATPLWPPDNRQRYRQIYNIWGNAMKDHQPLLFAAIVLLALPISARAQSAATTIRDIDRAYDRAFVEPNPAASLTRYFASDGTIIPANGPAVNGEKSINAFGDVIFSNTKFAGHVLQVVDVVPEGDNAVVARALFCYSKESGRTKQNSRRRLYSGVGEASRGLEDPVPQLELAARPEQANRAIALVC